MITTPDLIESLSATAGPVRRLRPPLMRAGLWLLLAGLILVLLAVLLGVREDISERLSEPTFALRLSGALATGILAAVAAFHLSLPDRSRSWGILPVPGVALWASTIGYGCLTNWVSLDPDGMRLGTAAQCFATLLLTSLPLSLAMLAMLRHAAPLRPGAVALSGGLAIAGVVAVALSIFHNIDATVMVLLWNLGVAAVITALAGAFGRRMFAWMAPRWLATGQAA
jgi:hypothetical protein